MSFSGVATSASWPTTTSAIVRSAGKIVFVSGGTWKSCTGTVVADGANGRSTILTAAHCVYNAKAGFATKWMFIPAYDARPVTIDSAGKFCANTLYGCWTGVSMVAPKAFTAQTSFNATAALNDYAFVRVGLGGKTGRAELDRTVPGMRIAFSALANNARPSPSATARPAPTPARTSSTARAPWPATRTTAPRPTAPPAP